MLGGGVDAATLVASNYHQTIHSQVRGVHHLGRDTSLLKSICRIGNWVKGAPVKLLRVSYNQNDETLSRNSLRYLSKANLTIAVN